MQRNPHPNDENDPIGDQTGNPARNIGNANIEGGVEEL